MAIKSKAGLIGLAAMAVAMIVYFTAWVGGVIADRFEHSVGARHFSAQLVTREVSPGDGVAIRVTSAGTFWMIRVGVGDGPLVDVWKANYDRKHEVQLVLETPADTQLGLLTIAIEVTVDVRIETDRVLNTVYYRNASRSDRLELPVPVISAADSTKHRWMSRGLALVAWLTACAASYAVARWSLRRISAKWRRKRKSQEDPAFVLCLVLAIALAVLGPIVFGRAILRTADRDLPVVVYGLQTLWVAAFVLGTSLGFRARAMAPLPRLWDPARLRAVLGSGREVGYREASPTLPPMLSREAPRCDSAQISGVFRELGCEVTATRGMLEVALDGDPVMRLRGKCPEPWLPEELELWVPDGIDATPLVLEMTKVFGPLEYKAPGAKPVILEP